MPASTSTAVKERSTAARSGTQLSGGPLDGKVYVGVNMHRAGDRLIIQGEPYVATGRQGSRGYWEAVYQPQGRRKGMNARG